MYAVLHQKLELAELRCPDSTTTQQQNHVNLSCTVEFIAMATILRPKLRVRRNVKNEE
jgi:hypothetical protein